MIVGSSLRGERQLVLVADDLDPGGLERVELLRGRPAPEPDIDVDAASRYFAACDGSWQPDAIGKKEGSVGGPWVQPA
jgi:hypothetical protein